MRHASLLASWLAALLVACAGSESSPSANGASGASTPPAAATSSTPPSASGESLSLPPEQRAALEGAAQEIVRFLAGEARIDLLALADSVELHLPAEATGTGSGASIRLAREALRDRDAWAIRTGSRSFSFVPPKGLTQTTARAGAHFNCRELALASRAPALASRPHVGVRLEPPESNSCLEGWNATFVFDTSGSRPRLVAALYDQWEW